MNQTSFVIDTKLVWALAIITLLLTITHITSGVFAWKISSYTKNLLLLFASANWLIIVSDIIKQAHHDRSFWLLGMFIMPTLVPIFYLIQRNKRTALLAK